MFRLTIPIIAIPSQAAAQGSTAPETIAVAIIAGLIGFLAGSALAKPRKKVVRDAIDAAFKVRNAEAEAHGRKKLSPALGRARLAGLGALEKLKLV